jgi:superfamily II DNA/RNA helicase
MALKIFFLLRVYDLLDENMSQEAEDEPVESLDEQEITLEDTENSFKSSVFSLSPQLISNLDRRGLKAPTPVQLQVIPKIRNDRGKDLCVNAPTGSGKTLAYALPIVQVFCVVIIINRSVYPNDYTRHWDAW